MGVSIRQGYSFMGSGPGIKDPTIFGPYYVLLILETPI